MGSREVLSFQKLSKGKLCFIDILPSLRETKLNSNIIFRKSRTQCSRKYNKGIAIIFGWTGAKHDDLKRYSAFLEMRGYSSVLVRTSKFQSICLPETHARKQVSTLLTLIRPWLPSKEQNPVILYAFSYTGSMMYIAIARALKDRGGPDYHLMNVKGTIFDSGPVFGALTRVSGIAQGSSLLINHTLLRQVVRAVCYIFFPLMVLLEPLMKRYMQEMYDDNLRCPQLFMYSKADPLRIVKDIRNLCLYRQNLTVTVRQKCWEDSPHCGNMERHPLDYECQVSEFLELCCIEDEVV